MKKVALHNLGCKVNTYELEIMQQNVQKRGYEIVDFAQRADIYIINTCSVTNIADRKSRQMLHRARKQNPDAIIVAVGCYAQTDTQGALNDEAIDIVIGNNNKSKIVDILEKYMEDRKANVYVDDLSVNPQYEQCGLTTSNERTRVDVKIQDGCNQFCTYCIIPRARGRIRSRNAEDIVKEISVLAKEGFKEIVLTGIHISSYGLDFHPDGTGKISSYNAMASKGDYTNRDLLEVINRVAQIEGIERIRLGSLEPRAITKEFVEAIVAQPKVCPHFHLSLQSGCDETLRRMNRHYSADEFLKKVELIREAYRHPAITTDIIVGFPGETKEEFEITCEFVDKVRFYETHIFKYSKRKGTPAATMPNQLTEKEKAARSDVLEEKHKKYSKEFLKELIGSRLEILTEEVKEIDGVEYTLGHTKDYAYAAVPGNYESNIIIDREAVSFLENNILLLK